jgi:AcrR family transcriptional regulator
MTGPSDTTTVPPPERRERVGRRVVPVQQRAKETVNLILETAAELVDEVGVVAFTTNLLAERANLRIRTIYRYFPNKLGILTALYQHLSDDSAGQMQWFARISDPRRDWRELVDTWITELVEWTRHRPGARFVMGWSHAIPELMAMDKRSNDEWALNMVDALRARGLDLPPAQLYAVSRIFAEVLDTLGALAASKAGDGSAEMIEESRRMLIRYLEQYLD